MNDINLWLAVLVPNLLTGAPFVVALLLGVGLPLLLIAVGSVTKGVSPTARLTLIMSCIVIGTAVSQALSGRTLYSDLQLEMNPFLGQAQNSPWGTLTSQAFTALALAMSIIELVRWAFGDIRLGTTARPLWCAMLGYFIGSMVIAGLFGIYRSPRLNDLYALIVLTAIGLLAGAVGPGFWRCMRWMLLLPSIASLVLAAVKPGLVLQPDYLESLIPGFHQRLFGLSDHANKMALVAAVAIVLEVCPLVRKRPSLIFLAVQLATLALTQSKTVIIGTLVATFLVRVSWLHKRLSGKDAWRGTAVIVMFLIGLLAVLTLGLAYALRATSMVSVLDRMGAFSLTGRTTIWAITLREFVDSPLTGYGPSLWDLRYRYEHNLMGVGQAHNNFVQVLGQAGAIGFATMLAYIGVMWRQVRRYGSATEGLGLGLFALLVIDCLSESPLGMGAIIGWENLLHLVAFAAIAGAGSAQVAKVVPLRRAAFVHRGMRPGLA